MVGDPLQFQSDATNHLGARRNRRLRQTLHGQAMRQGMADRRVTGQRLHVVHRPSIRPANQRVCHAAMLVPQRDLEVVNRFAVTLESEMARLNDARVHRPHGHFMDFVAGHLKEVGDAARHGSCGRGRGLSDCGRGSREADGFQPGMPDRDDSLLFPDFPFEPVGLRAHAGQRRILTVHRCDKHLQGRIRIAGHDGRQVALRLCRGLGEQSGDPPSGFDRSHDRIAPVSGRGKRHRRIRKSLAIVHAKAIGWSGIIPLLPRRPPNVTSWSGPAEHRPPVPAP